jgi:ribonuclease BN (tRNA processing enzyme)
VSDLLAANYALRYGDFVPTPAPVPVFGPTDWVGHVRPFLTTGESEPIDGTFEVHDLQDGERVEFGPLRLEAVATVHSVETYAVRATCGDHTVAYSADSGPCEALGRLADGVDLFVCEAAWPAWPEGADPIHLTPELAGQWAAKARARRLLLTHLRPGSDTADAVARAAGAYGGPVGLATELEVWEFGGRKERSSSPPKEE